MDSYVLVSTLTSSMSFGALLGFNPSTVPASAIPAINFLYQGLCGAIQVVAGLSAICGLYSTIIFSLTILYGKSALGAERDREYDKFLQSTARARVRGFRCFTLSLGLFALEAILVLVERTCFRLVSLPVCGTAAVLLYLLYKDWKLTVDSAEMIYKD